MTPLILAAGSEQTEGFNLLLSRGANINCTDKVCNVLYYIVMCNVVTIYILGWRDRTICFTIICDLLLSRGADINYAYNKCDIL